MPASLDELRAFACRVLEVEDLVCEPMTSGGSDRRYFRLRARDRAAVGAISGDAAELRAFLGFTRHFAALGIPVPAILAVDESRGLYVMEDLGPLTLKDWLAAQDGVPRPRERRLEAVEGAVRWLPVIQVRGGEGIDYGLCVADASMGAETYRADVRLFLNQFVRRYAPDVAPDPSAAEALNALAERCGELGAEHFCYRDFQTRNIMWRNGGPVFIDYQSGRRGPLVYDLVSILYSPDSRLDEPGRERLIGAYLEALDSCGLSPGRDAFLRGFYPMVLLRRMQALGAYARMAEEKGKREFLAKIVPSLDTLRELLESGRIAAESAPLRAWLETILERVRLPGAGSS